MPRKQKLFNLEDVLNLEKYDIYRNGNLLSFITLIQKYNVLWTGTRQNDINLAEYQVEMLSETRLNFLLVARCSLLFSRCSLLFSRCSLLFACCLLLFACCYRYFMLVARYFLLVARYLLLAHYFFVQITVKWNYFEPQKNGLTITKFRHKYFLCKYLRFW